MERQARYGVGEQSFEVITIDSLMGLDLDDPNPEDFFIRPVTSQSRSMTLILIS